MTDAPPPSPTTAEGDPAWLNPATIKGVIVVGLGMLFLLFPAASTPMLRYGFVLGTVVVGALIIMIPLGVTGATIINQATGTEKAHKAAEGWIDGYDELELGPVELEGVAVEVNISGVGGLPPIEELEASLSESLGKDVTVTVDYFETVRITFSKQEGLDSSETATTP